MASSAQKHRLDVYFSFRSPYSYFAIDRLAEIRNSYDVDFHFRLVRPLATRADGFFKQARPQFVPYLLRDVFREGPRLGIPIMWPQPDPITMNANTGEVAPDQPLIDRLIALGVSACEHGCGIEFAQAASKRIWAGGPDWDKGDALKVACGDLPVSFDDLEGWASKNQARIDEVIAENEAAQDKHHWGVPLMVINDEDPFFGQDRLDALRWRLDQLTVST